MEKITPSIPKPRSNRFSESLVFSMYSSWAIEPSPENLKMKPMPIPVPRVPKAPSPENPKPKSTSVQQVPQTITAPRLPLATLRKFPMPARNRTLLPPKSGGQTTSNGIYDQIFNNIAALEGLIRTPELTHQKTAVCVEYLKAKLLNAEMDVVLRLCLPDGFLIRFKGKYADDPRT